MHLKIVYRAKNALKNSRRDLMMSKIKSRVEEINYNNFGSEMVIKEYRNKKQIDENKQKKKWIFTHS